MIYGPWNKTPWYLRVFGYAPRRCWSGYTYNEGGFWLYEDGTDYVDPRNNIPESAKDRVLTQNAYYWVRTQRTTWFPAKWVNSCWFIAGKKPPLGQRVIEVGSIIVNTPK